MTNKCVNKYEHRSSQRKIENKVSKVKKLKLSKKLLFKVKYLLEKKKGKEKVKVERKRGKEKK